MADDGQGGKIPGKLKDALPVIPDKVADALEKGKDVPLEAFVSPAAAEMLADVQAARKEPVRMDSLTAVSKDDPRVQMNFGGGSLPKAPQLRRVIPSAYQRPRIAVDHHGKSWQAARAGSVRPGDIVPGVGLVQEARTVTRRASVAGADGVAVGLDIVLTGPESTLTLDAQADVQVFR